MLTIIILFYFKSKLLYILVARQVITAYTLDLHYLLNVYDTWWQNLPYDYGFNLSYFAYAAYSKHRGQLGNVRKGVLVSFPLAANILCSLGLQDLAFCPICL